MAASTTDEGLSPTEELGWRKAAAPLEGERNG